MGIMKRAFFAAILAIFCSSVHAFFVKPAYKSTSGNHEYKGENASVDFGGPLDLGDLGDGPISGKLHFKPSLSESQSDTSSGTVKTYSGRLAFDTEKWGVGLTAGKSPTLNQYSSAFFGADFSMSFTPFSAGGGSYGGKRAEKEEDDGFLRLDFGGGFTGTRHSDDFQGFVRNRRGLLIPRTKTLTIQQRDLDVTAGASFWDDVSLSGQATFTSYDKDLDKVGARVETAPRLAGVNSLVQGFPQKSLNARLELTFLPVVTPYGSYTSTTFALGTPPSKDAVAGVYADVSIVEVEVSFDENKQEGTTPPLKTISIGGNVRF